MIDVDENPAMTYFEVPGPFGVKGSTFSFVDRKGKLRTKTDCKHGKSFAAAVQWAAKQAGVTLVPKGRGVTVSVIYGFARPKKCDRADPCVRPDVDKLCRALMDALTGIAYHDDGQVVCLSVRKIYAEKVRARVVVMAEPLEEDPMFYVIVVALITIFVTLSVFRRWVDHERERHDEIRRRERLRVLLRPEDPRK